MKNSGKNISNDENYGFKLGDIVYVKSYPVVKMVISYMGRDEAACTYFCNDNFITEKFYYPALAKQEDINKKS